MHVDVIHANITDHAMSKVCVEVRGNESDKESGSGSLDCGATRIDFDKLSAYLDTADWGEVYQQTNASLAFDVFFTIFNELVINSKVDVRKKQTTLKK